ncbi:MAG TPA: hypothetical protein VGS41_16610 [Chthonomonadales bacterium]|nr:hypothetical protein [Chthonomonadales bacterium]
MTTFQSAGPRVLIGALLLAAPLLSGGCGGGSGSGTSLRRSILDLHTISALAVVTDANGDRDPRGLVVMPPASATFPGDKDPSHIQPGDILASNFSNSAGVAGMGTTLEAIRSGKAIRVFSEANAPVEPNGSYSTIGPTGLAVGQGATLWIANYGTASVAGNVEVVSAAGKVLTWLTATQTQRAWSIAFNNGSANRLAYFTSNPATGIVYRINIVVANAQAKFTVDQLSPDLGHSGSGPSDALVPCGLTYGPGDTLYVVDGVNNTLIAIANSSVSGVTPGVIVFSGKPLNQPAGMTLNPVNGDLIVANGADNNLVEISPAGKLVGEVIVDNAPVSGRTGAALAGVTAATDAQGNLVVYFTDRNDNTVRELR